jgi:hypothetical protein
VASLQSGLTVSGEVFGAGGFYPEVEHKDGTRSMARAEMKKSIYSLAPLREFLPASHRRYLEFISAIEDDRADTDQLNIISQPVEENDRRNRGFNFFDFEDEDLFEPLCSGEFNISDSGTKTFAGGSTAKMPAKSLV